MKNKYKTGLHFLISVVILASLVKQSNQGELNMRPDFKLLPTLKAAANATEAKLLKTTSNTPRHAALTRMLASMHADIARLSH